MINTPKRHDTDKWSYTHGPSVLAGKTDITDLLRMLSCTTQYMISSLHECDTSIQTLVYTEYCVIVISCLTGVILDTRSDVLIVPKAYIARGPICTSPSASRIRPVCRHDITDLYHGNQ